MSGGFGGGVMLGPVVLQAYEVPERVTFGGRQQMAVHRLPGGGRVIDAMGPDEQNLVWQGMMLGPDAADRARMLDQLRQSGAVVPLLFGDMAYAVIVADFEADYRGTAWIGRYRIACMVLPGAMPPLASLAANLESDLNAASELDPDGVVAAAAALASSQMALQSAGILIAGSSGTDALQTALGGARSVLAATQGAAEAAMSAAITTASVSGSIGGTAGLLLVAGDAEQLARSGAMAGLIGRAQANLGIGAS